MNFIVLSWYPFTRDAEVNLISLESFSDAKRFAECRKKNGCDVLIVRKENKLGYNDKEVTSYFLENYGFYKTYKVISVFLFGLLLSFFFTLLYLYLNK